MSSHYINRGKTFIIRECKYTEAAGRALAERKTTLCDHVYLVEKGENHEIN